MKSITISGQSSSLHPSIKMLSLKSTKKLAFPKRLIIEQRTSSTWILHGDERATSDVGRHENRAECLGPCRCMCVLVSGLMWDGVTWKYSLASEWRRQKHNERAMKVICLVMNGAHHLRVVARHKKRETRTNRWRWLCMWFTIFVFSLMIIALVHRPTNESLEILTFRCGFELLVLLFPPPLPRLEQSPQGAKFALAF